MQTRLRLPHGMARALQGQGIARGLGVQRGGSINASRAAPRWQGLLGIVAGPRVLIKGGWTDGNLLYLPPPPMHVHMHVRVHLQGLAGQPPVQFSPVG